jgi:hypothetical protein
MKTNKLKNKLMLLALVLVVLNVNAQTQINLDTFSKLEVNGNMDLLIVQSESNKIESKHDGKPLDYKVEGNKLFIRGTYADESIILYVKNLQAIETSGLSNVASKNEIKASERFSIVTSGSSEVEITLNTPLLKCEATGLSKQTIKGRGDKLVVDISGNADLNAFEFICNEAIVDASGLSDFNITANKKLVLDASGSSDGKYKGTPASKVISVTGMASIKAMDENETYNDERTEMKVGVEGDTVAFDMGNKKIIITEKGKSNKDEKDGKTSNNSKKYKEMKDVWSGLEMGFDNLITPSGKYSFEYPNEYLNTRFGSSYHIGLNLFEPDWKIIDGHLSIASGLGIEWQSLKFEGNRVLAPKILNGVAYDTNTYMLTYNRLNLTSFTLPILVKLISNPSKSGKRFHIAAGVILNYTPWATVKMETTANGYSDKREFDYDNNINPLRVSATVRIGYGWLRLFANYGLTPVFNSAAMPDTRTASVGITVIPF